MDRNILKFIRKDLDRKIIIVTGPRQCGKTTLSKSVTSNYTYLNHDIVEDRLLIQQKSWKRGRLLILDELHKMKNWKLFLKALYDDDLFTDPILVTGSARMDAYKKVGDSLAGRHFEYRLHPLDVREVYQDDSNNSPQEINDRILKLGGFPEPFLENDSSFYGKWKRSHIDLILRQDGFEDGLLKDLRSVENLIEVLRRCVGSPLTFDGLARQIGSNGRQVKKWLEALESLYILFSIPPYTEKVSRSILKSKKYYFYDTGQLKVDDSLKAENLAACSLLKTCDYFTDCLGRERKLFYLRDKNGKEVDFVVVESDRPVQMIEAKWSDANPSSSLSTFLGDQDVERVQLCYKIDLKQEKDHPNGVKTRQLSNWLAKSQVPG